MAPKGKRIPCAGKCGRDILPFYNPSMLCRKCSRLRVARVIRENNKAKRRTNDDRKKLPA